MTVGGRDVDPDGIPAPPPHRLLPNPHTLLDVSDLVFVDPVSTGYSLLGESYGTVRAAGLADYLQRRFSLYLNGVVLISPALSQQTYIPGGCCRKAWPECRSS